MQMCPNCDNIYDSTEYSKCPNCYTDDGDRKINIVYDDNIGTALELTEEEFEEFKKIHLEYR